MIPAVQILNSLALALVCASAGLNAADKRGDLPPVLRLACAVCLIGAQVCAAFGRPYP